MDWFRNAAAEFMALPPASKGIIFGVLAFLAIRTWLFRIGAWTPRGRDGDGGAGGIGDDGGDGGCD